MKQNLINQIGCLLMINTETKEDIKNFKTLLYSCKYYTIKQLKELINLINISGIPNVSNKNE